jgi:SAM-dependent methyltransferase
VALTRRPDPFMACQRDLSLAVAASLKTSNFRILDVGCGTGWWGHALASFGQVWDADLTEMAVSEGRRRFPEVTFIVGDFASVPLSAPYDLIVTADAFLHFDHARAVQRFASLKPDGTLLLMTQNPFVWKRRPLRPFPSDVPNGRLDQWPTRRQIRGLLDPHFTVDRVTTLEPGGNRGVLCWVENRPRRRQSPGRTRTLPPMA